MNTLKIKLNSPTVQRIQEIVKKDKTSIEHFIELAVAEKISSLYAVEYLNSRAKKGSKQKLKKILAKAPDREPFDFDK